MAKRHRMSKKTSRKQFKGAAHTHKRNISTGPMRGGIRL